MLIPTFVFPYLQNLVFLICDGASYWSLVARKADTWNIENILCGNRKLGLSLESPRCLTAYPNRIHRRRRRELPAATSVT